MAPAALALEELKRACEAGAVGIVVLANIDGKPLTDGSFRKIWEEIDRRAKKEGMTRSAYMVASSLPGAKRNRFAR